MESFNDIANTSNKASTTNNDIDIDILSTIKVTELHQHRTTEEHEKLAWQLKETLGVVGSNLKPYLAASYSGISKANLERYAAMAAESQKVRSKPALFFWFIKREPLWNLYQANKQLRRDINE